MVRFECRYVCAFWLNSFSQDLLGLRRQLLEQRPHRHLRLMLQHQHQVSVQLAAHACAHCVDMCPSAGPARLVLSALFVHALCSWSAHQCVVEVLLGPAHVI